MTTPSRSVLRAALVLAALAFPLPACSQSAPAARATDTSGTPKADEVPPLYASEAPLAVTLTANLRQLRGDKDTNSAWRGGTISYQSDTGRIVIPARMRTRGIWRLKNCAMPPLRLDFGSKDTKGILFRKLGKPKLVNYCRDTDTYEQYILQELQLYRIYQLLTPVSYRVRLVRMTYVDSASGKTDAVRYAIIAEDPDHLAKRLDGHAIKIKGATASDLDHQQLALAYLFQYMIGNTDFSFNGLHNTALISTNDGRVLPVAYDFDYAGAVNASYATPDPSLRIKTVRQRSFRGYCALADEYPQLLPLFNERKLAIYALYKDQIGQLMDARRVRETVDYYDDFFKQIESPSAAQGYFLRDCVGPR